jgi:hypothetical protein
MALPVSMCEKQPETAFKSSLFENGYPHTRKTPEMAFKSSLLVKRYVEPRRGEKMESGGTVAHVLSGSRFMDMARQKTPS